MRRKRTLESISRFRQLLQEVLRLRHGRRDGLGGEVKEGAAARLGGLGVDELVDRGDLEPLGVSFVAGSVEEVAEHEDEL